MKRAHSLQEIVDAGYAPSVRCLRDLIKRGEVPAFRVNRKGRGGHPEWRMTDDDLEAFIESRRNAPKVEPSITTLNLTPAAALRRRRVS